MNRVSALLRIAWKEQNRDNNSSWHSRESLQARNELLTHQMKNNRKHRRRKMVAMKFVPGASSHPDLKATDIEFNTSNQTNLKDTL